MDISIVIVNWNTKRLLVDCLTSVFETVREVAFEVWVVDNASTDGSVEAVAEKFPGVRIIRNRENLGFAAANNLAFRQMNGRYALLLNTDTVLAENAIHALYGFMEKNPGAGMACGQLLNADGSKQNSMANFPTVFSLLANETVLRILFPNRYPSKRKSYAEPIGIESCIGACMIVRKAAMDAVGLLDERYFFFFEETDWAYRMRSAGWKVWFVPSAKIYHLQGQSVGHHLRSRIMFYRARYTFFKKWHPERHFIVQTVVFGRLVVNAALNLLMVIFTLGLQSDFKRKLHVYARLIVWHISGCPKQL